MYARLSLSKLCYLVISHTNIHAIQFYRQHLFVTGNSMHSICERVFIPLWVGATRKQTKDMYLHDKCNRALCMVRVTDHTFSRYGKVLKCADFSQNFICRRRIFFSMESSCAYMQFDHGHINVYKVSTFFCLLEKKVLGMHIVSNKTEHQKHDSEFASCWSCKF